MNKVLVTGATGFLGYHLLKELETNGVQIYALCRKNTTGIERIQTIKNLHIIYCGLEEVDRLPELCQERDFDVLYHLAWRGASGEERADSVIQAQNIVWNLEIARIAKTMGVKKLVVTGTVCENQCDAIIKQHYTGKSAYYLLAKHSAYELLSVACKRMELPLAWCTFYHPIGKYNKPEQIIMNTILKLQRGENPRFGPADKLFDIIAAEDLVHALFLAGTLHLKKDRYFIGSGEPKKLKEYLYIVQSVINPNTILDIGYYLDDGLPMEREWLETGNFYQETGFCTKKTFHDSLQEIRSSLGERNN